MPGTLGALAAGEAVLAAGLSLAIGLPLVLFGPPPGDLPAHLYRTELVRDGVLVWDTFWYAGHYPFVGYSLLYYFPAALLGNDVLALVAVVAASALFATLAVREWGDRARWSARAFAVVACGPAVHRHLPVRGCPRDRARGAPRAPVRPEVDGRRALRAHRRALAARVPVPVPRRARGVPRARPAPRSDGGRRRRRPDRRSERSRERFSSSTGTTPSIRSSASRSSSRSSPSPRPARHSRFAGENGRGLAILFGLWALAAVDRLRRPVADRRERHPPPRNRPPAHAPRRRDRLLPAALAHGDRPRRRARLHARPLRRGRARTGRTPAPRARRSGSPLSTCSPPAGAPTIASRSSPPATTGRRTTSPGRASRSREGGTGSSTSPRTRSSTRRRSSRPSTGPGWRASASATCCSRTRSSAGWGRSGRPSSSAPGGRACSRSPAPGT